MKEVLSAYNDFLNTKERCFMLSFVFVFFVYSFNVLPSDALFLIAIGIFILSSARASMLMFMFFSLWENVAIFSFGGTLNFVLQLILLVKILFLPHSIWRDVSRNRLFTLSLLFTVFLWIYGTFDVLFNSFTGIGLAIKMTFGLYVLCFYQDMKTSSCFWKAVLFTIMISSFLSANYGFFHESAVERWISGMGERIGQLYGTLGTTRLGMFLVVSMIYPLYYIKNNIVKSIVLVALLVLVAKTVSVTSFILVFVLFSIYAFSLRGKKKSVGIGATSVLDDICLSIIFYNI